MNSVSPAVTVGSGPVSIADVVRVARHDAPVLLDSTALAAVAQSRAVIDALAADPHPHYGISTGFGAALDTSH